jgi:hypothetical protein
MPQDPFAQFVVGAAPRAPRATVDPFAQFAAPAQSAPEPSAASSWLDSAKNFVGNFAHTVDPRPALKLLYDVSGAYAAGQTGNVHGADALLEDLKGLVGSHAEQFKKGKQAYDAGRYSEAVGHTMAGVLPLVGPAAANAGEQIGSGDVSGGMGAATGLLAGMVAPAAIAKAKGSINIPGLAPVNPATAEAVALAERNGVPLDAATATGNRAVAAVQHVVDRSLGGSMIAEKAAHAQAQGLATLGEQLAAKGHATPVTPEIAGQGTRDAVLGQVRKHAADADEAYTALRTIEADPAHADTIHAAEQIPRDDAPFRFVSKPKATSDDIFLSALQDARKSGYKGSAAELKGIFDDKIKSARGLAKDMNGAEAEYGDRALLKSIRDLGGLRMFEKDLPNGSPAARLTDEADNVKGFFKGQRVYTERGLANDDLVTQLRQDPRWAAKLDPDTDMNEVLRNIAAQEKHGTVDVQNALHGVGVRPGIKWWESQESKTIPMAVDLRPAREALGPVYESLKREAELVPLMGDKARALTSLDRLLNGPEHASLSTVDAALGELKTFARSDEPALRSIGQGKVAGAIKHLDAAVRARAAEAGPLALEALEAGRKSTIDKYGAGSVLESLNAEPVRTFQKIVSRGDSAVGHLREIAKQAPEELPKIGRAYIDDLLQKAKGDKKGAAAIFNEWNDLGAETKRILYKDPGYINDLDSFFRLAKKSAENSNTSGTAHTILVGGHAGLMFTEPVTGVSALLGQAVVSKFLHSPGGVRLLTKGLKVPMRGSKAASAAYVAELSSFAQQRGFSLSPSMADGSQQETGAPTARR